jgi:hypothetical protein
MRYAIFVLLALLLPGPAAAQDFVPECRVMRLATAPAPRDALGGLGMPPTHLTQAEIERTAGCLATGLDRAFAAVRDRAVLGKSWTAMSRAYKASEHGTFLQVFADAAAAPSYARYEAGARMGEGATVIKRALRVEADGRARPYRIYVMERMRAGYEPGVNDWRFAVYEPTGALVGETGGQGNARVRFCAECHAAARAQDFLLFVPPAYRIPLSTR